MQNNEAKAAPVGAAVSAQVRFRRPEKGMPEQKSEGVRHRYQEFDFIDGWNACLDEFDRLNGKEVV